MAMNAAVKPLAVAAAGLVVLAAAAHWVAAAPWADAVATGWLAPLVRGVVAGVAIGALLWVLRRGGPRFAGLLASLPVTSAPALFWLSLDYGAAAAATAAQASLYATGLTAVLALAYAHAARRWGPAASLVLALAVVLAAALATLPMAGTLSAVVAAVALALAVALRALPRLHGAAAPCRPARHQTLVGAAVAALLTTVVLALAPRLPAQWVGLIAAIPVIGAASMVLVHRQVAPPALAAFLRAYVSGLVLKSVFLLVLAVALALLGMAAAWALAGVGVVTVAFGAGGVRRWLERAKAHKTGAENPGARPQ